MSLANETCSACHVDAPSVTDQEIETLHADIPEWKVVEEDGTQKLQRQFTFSNFQQALAFTNKVGELAESLNHHPAIITEWGSVTVIWWTHKIHGLHRNDFVCAAKTDELSK